jgi:hypothetical protein
MRALGEGRGRRRARRRRRARGRRRVTPCGRETLRRAERGAAALVALARLGQRPLRAVGMQPLHRRRRHLHAAAVTAPAAARGCCARAAANTGRDLLVGVQHLAPKRPALRDRGVVDAVPRGVVRLRLDVAARARERLGVGRAPPRKHLEPARLELVTHLPRAPRPLSAAACARLFEFPVVATERVSSLSSRTVMVEGQMSILSGARASLSTTRTPECHSARSTLGYLRATGSHTPPSLGLSVSCGRRYRRPCPRAGTSFPDARCSGTPSPRHTCSSVVLAMWHAKCRRPRLLAAPRRASALRRGSARAPCRAPGGAGRNPSLSRTGSGPE